MTSNVHQGSPRINQKQMFMCSGNLFDCVASRRYSGVFGLADLGEALCCEFVEWVIGRGWGAEQKWGGATVALDGGWGRPE